MKDFRRLKVWERSHQLALEVYRATARFPRNELFGLVSLMRRAAVSIPSNLAEGCGRRSDAELGRFADISMASASELEYQILLAKDLEYIADRESCRLGAEVVEVKQMLTGPIKHVRQGKAPSRLGVAG